MRTILRLLGLAAGLLALVWLAVIAAVVLAAARPTLRGADAILVLGAAQYDGRPSPVLRARLDHAVQLHSEGYAPRLIVTGGVGTGDTVSEGDVARRYAVRQGVPESAILVERWGRTSAESIGVAAELMRDAGLRSVLVVSDPFHMLRLQVLLWRTGIRSHRAPAPGSPITRNPVLYWRYVLRESVLVPLALVGGPGQQPRRGRSSDPDTL